MLLRKHNQMTCSAIMRGRVDRLLEWELDLGIGGTIILYIKYSYVYMFIVDKKIKVDN